MNRLVVSFILILGAVCILCVITLSQCQSGASNMEFYVTIPGDKSGQKYTDADVVSNEAFKMICKYTSTKASQNCAALWLYGSTGEFMLSKGQH